MKMDIRIANYWTIINLCDWIIEIRDEGHKLLVGKSIMWGRRNLMAHIYSARKNSLALYCVWPLGILSLPKIELGFNPFRPRFRRQWGWEAAWGSGGRFLVVSWRQERVFYAEAFGITKCTGLETDQTHIPPGGEEERGSQVSRPGTKRKEGENAYNSLKSEVHYAHIKNSKPKAKRGNPYWIQPSHTKIYLNLKPNATIRQLFQTFRIVWDGLSWQPLSCMEPCLEK